jgi:cobalt-precorrin 5A hydrolase / precorrin-3B C17-methyltransferase
MTQIPRRLWIGVGCKRGTSVALIQHAFETTCQTCGLDRAEISGIATLDRKVAEAGLLEFGRTHLWPIRFFTATELKVCTVPNISPSAQVAIGIPSVAEAAALTAARLPYEGGKGAAQLIALKRSFRLAHEPGAVTFAIAQTLDESFVESSLKLNRQYYSG